MLTKRELKLWIMSGSLRFALNDRPQDSEPPSISSVQWNGNPVYYRVGTSDIGVIDSILLKRGSRAEYFIPRPIQPAIIFDIGGNIGTTALYYARAYPKARILSFEPIPSNFELLEKNIAPYSNIEGFNIALGSNNETLQLIESPDFQNLGGYSIYQRGATPECKQVPVSCRNICEIMEELNAIPNLLKVDTEGAESLILRALPDDIISRVLWIVGELHGEDDFELLAHLSKWFEIGISKSVDGPLCIFHARNKSLVL